jgi:hypothetical protein
MSSLLLAVLLVASTRATPAAAQQKFPDCDPSAVELLESPQWAAADGYWIGELSLFNQGGDPYTSASWPYRYDSYKGFITGEVVDNAYRQRNVFMYPPASPSTCAEATIDVVGGGECGVNGNMKVFDADQAATSCSTNPALRGDIEGPYGSMAHTTTELIGRDNAMLYQVWMTKEALNFYEAVVLENPYGRCVDGHCGYDEDRLMQSQLTTHTETPDGGALRTRTAQGFDAFVNVGAPTYASFYRERRVSEEEFWTEFNATLVEYDILESDLCAWRSGETGGTITSGLAPGFASCKAHLESSFLLADDLLSGSN